MKNLDMEQANTSEHPVQDHEELRDTEFLSEVTGGELSRQWTTIGTGAIGGLFGSVGGGPPELY